jgi:RimJ/RimL family protein N-acetyltransferase
MIELREFLEKDIWPIAENANNSNVVKYMSDRMPHPYTKDDARWWVETGCKESGINRAICVDDDCIGVVGVYTGTLERKFSAEIGYWIGENYWGKGYTTRAVGLFTDYIFNNTEIIRLSAPVFHPNTASMKVLENNGFHLEAVHKKAIYKNGNLYDEHLFVKFCS